MAGTNQLDRGFAAGLRELIEVSGLTQGEVARRADVSPQVVSRLLTAGNADVTLSVACRLAWALGKSVSEFEDIVFEEWKMQPQTLELIDRAVPPRRAHQKLDTIRDRIAKWEGTLRDGGDAPAGQAAARWREELIRSWQEQADRLEEGLGAAESAGRINLCPVTLTRFPDTYLDRADQVFLHPTSLYSWDEIVTGAEVRRRDGTTRRMAALMANTSRGFHKINKNCPGAQEGFHRYFLDQRPTLLEALSAVSNQPDLHRLANRICEGVRQNLGNIRADQLKSYNKIRKPVDLHLMNLVGMARELAPRRGVLVPLLFLPLDKEIIKCPDLFTDRELAAHQLTRASTYGDVKTERTYLSLQELIHRKADTVAMERCRPFYPIYFDLLWNDRDRRWGGNLFETCP